MKINYLNLKAFGHFTDYYLHFDDKKNFHLLYGPNEAGKSTILRSITNYLYGFPKQTPDTFLHNNQKLRIEGELQNKKGEKLNFARRKGQTKTVLDANNNPIDENQVLQFLNGMSKDQFNNMFALDHIRLREGGESLLQSDGNVGQSLFSAASGMNALRHVLDEIDSKTSNLYSKNRPRSAINSAIKEEKDSSVKITENQMKIKEWKDLERNYVEGKKKIEELKATIKELSSMELKYLRLKQTLPKIALYKEMQEKCTELSSVPDLPENMEELRKENLRNLELAMNAEQKALKDIEQAQQQLQTIVIPEGILDQAAFIESLYRESSSYRKDVEQVPILQGENRQLEQSIHAKLRELGQVTDQLDTIEQYRISTELKKTIHELANQNIVLENNEKKANDDYISINYELAEIQSDIQEVNEAFDVESLDVAISRIRDEGKLENLLKEKEEELRQFEKHLAELIRSLPLFNGTSDELLQLKVPTLKETIKKFQKDYDESTSRKQLLQNEVKDEMEAILKYENRISELESLSDIPTVSKLQEARKHRDEGWLVIRQKLNTGIVDEAALSAFSEDLPLDFAFENSIRESDSISDTMRTEAEKVGVKNNLLLSIEKSENNLITLTSSLKSIEEKEQDWNNQWKEHWQSVHFEPLTPLEMLEWLDQYEAILERNQSKEKVAVQVSELKEKIAVFKLLLQGILAEIEPAADYSTLDLLVKAAERTSKRVAEEKNNHKNAVKNVKKINKKLEIANEKVAETGKDLEAWKGKWDRAIENLKISKDTSPTVVKDLLESYENCVNNYDKLKQTEKELDALTERIIAFESKVKSMRQIINIDLIPNAMDLAVKSLFEALQKANKDQIEMSNLNSQIMKAIGELEEAKKQITQANMVLKKQLEQACCDSIEELEKIESDYKEKCKWKQNIEQIEVQIIDLGNGRMLDNLLEEANLVNKDTLDIDLEEVKNELKTLDLTRSEMEQAHGVVRNEYTEKIEGTNFASVKAAEEKQSKLATIAGYTDEYITHKLASLLLQKGIEYYRENNQSPILNRASEIFKRLTLGSFDGLTVDYDKKDQPIIMGVRNQDEKVEISGMSDGTTDQLYLALRIASIALYVKDNEPIPFIVDDILVHFDDERSKETLVVLLELSKHTQIIFFTHHYRLIELMNAVTNDNSSYQLKELNTVTV
jgi:uncharacterized protein YhaN